MKPKRVTPEMDALFAQEAQRRADHQKLKERQRTKLLAEQTGLAYGSVANIISRKRREIESKLSVSCETLTFSRS